MSALGKFMARAVPRRRRHDEHVVEGIHDQNGTEAANAWRRGWLTLIRGSR